MPSYTTSPSIDNGQKQVFRNNFFELAQQKQSKLQSTGAIMFMPSDGKTVHLARMGGNAELVEVSSRNPDKQYGDYALDNRFMRKRRFTRTYQIDAKQDIKELLADPTSQLLQQLNYSRLRLMDRIAVEAAVGSVLTGAPDTSGSLVSASSDGVITVDGTSTGATYEKIQEITENFINNDIFELAQMGTTLCVSGMENTDLMGEVEFISNDYISPRPVETGYQRNAGMYKVALFAGSKTSGITVTNPILPEASTVRKNVVLAPEAIAMSMEIADIGVEKSGTKVNSFDITLDFWINAMRTEGPRVQILTTTY